MFQSLFWKISLSVGIVVTLTLLIFASFIIENQKEHLSYAKIKEIETLSTLSSHGIILFMKEGRKDDLHHFLDLFGISDDLLEVRILDEAGRVLHSSRKVEQGTSMAGLLSGKNVGTKISPVFEQEIRGKPFLGALQVFPNEPACFSCHGNQKKTLGILHVGLPMEETVRSIRLNRNLLIASTGITLLLLAAAVNLLLTRMVKEPTARLIETMSRVEGGNLDVEVQLGTQDELGRLSRNFNSMVRKLSAAQKQVERQHQEQMRQVQHLASLGELAASVAHEIRNPLAGIKYAVQMLARERGLEAHGETIAEIMKSIERLDKTMTDLLLYSRLRPPEVHPVFLPEVIGDVLSSLKEEFQVGRVRVETDFDPALPPLPLDFEQMVKVFFNLFLNAIQAMPGGGTLTIRTHCESDGSALEAPRGGVPEAEGSRWAEVTVKDTGQGMSPEVLEEIFRPFFTTKAKGTGLGLSLCRRVVEQHRGQIFARSETGAGTAFTLRLPLSSSCGAVADECRGLGEG